MYLGKVSLQEILREQTGLVAVMKRTRATHEIKEKYVFFMHVL